MWYAEFVDVHGKRDSEAVGMIESNSFLVQKRRNQRMRLVFYPNETNSSAWSGDGMSNVTDNTSLLLVFVVA